MAVSKRLRFEVLKRDQHTCRYCGGVAPDVVLTIDHVVPVTLGGSDEPANLVAACKDCNSGKSSVPADAPLVAGVADDAVRMAKALELVAEQRAAERKEAEAIYRKFKKEWRSWYRTDWQGTKRYVELPGDWQRSIDQFLNAGLTLDDLLQMVGVAMGGKNRDEWKYFCGCCWKLLKEIQERAAAIVHGPAPALPDKEVVSIWTRDDLLNFNDSAAAFILDEWPDYDPFKDKVCVHGRLRDCLDLVCQALQHTSAMTWIDSRKQFGDEVSEMLDELAEKHRQEREVGANG